MNPAIQHEFIAIDEGHATLLHINEADQAKNWIVPIGQPAARDLQLIGGNKILIGHHRGHNEFDLNLGRVVKQFAVLEGVTAVRDRQKQRDKPVTDHAERAGQFIDGRLAFLFCGSVLFGIGFALFKRGKWKEKHVVESKGQ